MSGAPRVRAEALGRLQAWLDAERGRRQLELAGELVAAVVEDGARCRYERDARGELAAIVEADGRRSAYRYDDEGRLARVEHADGGVTRYRYGAHDRVTEIDDRGVRFGFEHDDAGRLRLARRGSAGAIALTWDDAGHVVEARTHAVTTRHGYDAAGRMVAIEQLVDGVAVSLALTYDEHGRLAALQPSGAAQPIRYEWDERGRPRVVRWGDRELARFATDGARRELRVRLGNGVVEESRFDVDGRPLLRRVGRGDETLWRRDYAHGAAGELVDDGVCRYGYDALGRLAAADAHAGDARWRWRYDAHDRRLATEDPGGHARHVHDGARAERVLRDRGGGEVLHSDARGRLFCRERAGGDWLYVYDDADQLLEVRHGGVTVARFDYDHKGRLVRRRDRTGGERYLYGPDDELLAVADERGRPRRLFVRTPLGLVAEVREGAIAFLHHDHRGTCHLATDEHGAVIGRAAYDPFGVPAASGGMQPIFNDRVYDAAVGLYRWGARWYDPGLGRFLTPDSFTAAPDDERLIRRLVSARAQRRARAELLADWLRRPRLRNRYAFCGNDPLNQLDPDGHWSFGGVLLTLLGVIWALPATLIGLVLAITNLVGEVIRWLVGLIATTTWQPLGFDAAASGRLDAFGIIFEGGWLMSVLSRNGTAGITFGNVIFVDADWRSSPYNGPGQSCPPAYHGAICLPQSEVLYEHELRHTNQYGWFGLFFYAVYLVDFLIHGYYDAWTETDARDHSEGPPPPPPPRAIVLASRIGAATPAPLADAWVYWQTASGRTVLRSDAAGALLALRAGQDASLPWSYDAPFTAPSGDHVGIYASRCACRLPDAFLDGNPQLFQARSVPPPPPGVASSPPPARLVLEGMIVSLAAPAQLGLWPLLWEPLPDAYATAGLAQGAALWSAAHPSSLAQPDFQPPPAGAPAASRARPRGLRVAGTIDARATGVTLQLLGASGAALPLRATRDAAASVHTIDAVLAAPSGDARPFTATVYLADPAAAFGPLFVVVSAAGVTPPLLEAFRCHLIGVQIGLVDDRAKDVAGTQRGPLPRERDERTVVDFTSSPAGTLPAIQGFARRRRMNVYAMGVRDRRLDAAGPPVMQPEMPLFMAELQLVGLGKAQLEDLLARRLHGPDKSARLQIDASWRLELAWRGPDLGTANPYRYALPITFAQTAAITPAADGTVDDAKLADAVAFPVAGRRAPGFIVKGQQRPWSRGAPPPPDNDAIVIEWQPAIVDPAGGREIMRGGDGTLALDALSIAGQAVDPGLVIAAGTPAPPPAGTPIAALPTFRVVGENPDGGARLLALLDELVRLHYNANLGQASVGVLPLAAWQAVMRGIVNHEAGRVQFEARDAHIERYLTDRHGHERLMPVFGPPHGYGIAQMDPPGSAGVTPSDADDNVWSFLANLRAGIRQVMHDKARSAYNAMRAHFASPPSRRDRAAFQREVVRRYNGTTEFRWSGTDWEIHPTLHRWDDEADHSQGPNRNLRYPNGVLGTTVVYWTGSGAAATFPWPIAFGVGDYGPGI